MVGTWQARNRAGATIQASHSLPSILCLTLLCLRSLSGTRCPIACKTPPSCMAGRGLPVAWAPGLCDLASAWPFAPGVGLCARCAHSLQSPLQGGTPDRAPTDPRTGEDFKTGHSFAEHSSDPTQPCSPPSRLCDSPPLSIKNWVPGPRIRQCPGGSSHNTQTRVETRGEVSR